MRVKLPKNVIFRVVEGDPPILIKKLYSGNKILIVSEDLGEALKMLLGGMVLEEVVLELGLDKDERRELMKALKTLLSEGFVEVVGDD